jgi:signal transduction histidine kinase
VADRATSSPVRTLMLLRILTLYPVALGWRRDAPGLVEVGLLAVLVTGTALLALRWAAIAPRVRRHPAWGATDVAASLVVLAYAGPQSPFVAYTLTSAALVGFVYPHLSATLLCTLLGSGYLLLRTVEDPGAAVGPAQLSVPVAYVVLAVASASFRRMQDRLSSALSAAVAAERSAATANERTRLARDLHDGVCSTLHGLVLQSTAVSRTADHSDPAVARLARELEQAARAALAQSREVLTGLRRDDDSAPLVQAVSDRVHRWSDRTGIDAAFSATGVADVDPAARIAALRVLDEALENVRRHADATRVDVALVGDERQVRLDVTDDGQGVAADRPGVLQGHYGLLGMTERAGVAGGVLSLRPGAPDGGPRPGTTVRLELPRGVPA